MLTLFTLSLSLSHTLSHSDRLALFMGAGVSVGAGLPTWAQLLTSLGRKGGMTEKEIETLGKMNFLDQVRAGWRVVWVGWIDGVFAFSFFLLIFDELLFVSDNPI